MAVWAEDGYKGEIHSKYHVEHQKAHSSPDWPKSWSEALVRVAELSFPGPDSGTAVLQHRKLSPNLQRPFVKEFVTTDA